MNNIYIDYVAGTYGSFLHFLIRRFVLKHEKFVDSFPMHEETGTFHARNFPPKPYTTDILLYHFSVENISIPAKSNDLIVQIICDFKNHRYPMYYNQKFRGGVGVPIHKRRDTSFLLKTFYHGVKDVKTLRNIMYAACREPVWYGIGYTNFQKNTVAPIYEFNFESFTTAEKLYQEINNIAFLFKKSDVNIDFGDFQEVWQKFYENSGGLKSKETVDYIFANICNDINADLSELLIIEQAYLNALITEYFDIHSDISVFDEIYPKESITIIKEIKQVLKNRNPLFDINKSIAEQRDQITLFP